MEEIRAGRKIQGSSLEINLNAGMQAKGLIDTGALLALLDADDGWHHRCVEAFSILRLPLGTTNAVLTELFHLVGHDERQMSAAWKLVRSDAFVLLSITNDDLPKLDELMHRYKDRPMDFADATLVLLAERLALTTVFTIDNDDFETYRVNGKKRLTVLPGRG